MRFRFKKLIVMMLCVSLVLTVCLGSTIAAGNNVPVANADGQIVKVLKNDTKTLTVVMDYLGDDDEYKGTVLYATMDKTSKAISMKTVQKPKKKLLGLLGSSKEKITNYSVKIVNEKEREFLVKDLETKKEYRLKNSDGKVKAQIPFVIWGLGAAGLALLKALLTVLAIGVAVTAVYMVGSYAYSKAGEIADALKRQKASKYYRACISNGQVMIGEPLDYSTCYNWVSARGDCFAPVEYDAKMMAQAVGGVARGPEIHGTKTFPYYMWHYQPKYANFYDSHCFFR